MKKQVFKTGLIVLLSILFIAPSVAQDSRETVKKEIKKHYDIDQGFTLGVDNKYGNIDIVNWDKDEIDVTVWIEVKAPSKEKAEKALKSIEIQIEEAKNHVYFETDYNSDSFAPKTSVKVSYAVSVPPYINANLEQKYGNIHIQELLGRVIAEVKYGKLKADALLNENEEDMNVIELAYSDLDIEESPLLSLEVKYGEVNIEEAGLLELDSKYSKVYLETVETLLIDSKYDKIKVGKTSNLAEIESDYSSVNLGLLAKDFKLVSAEMSYGNLNAILAPDAGFHINAEVSYGGLNIPNGDYEKGKDGNTKYVEGKIGNPGESLIEVEIRYGSLNLN